MFDSPANRTLLHGLVLGLLIGVLIGIGVASGVNPLSAEVHPDDPDPGLTYGQAGPSCFDGIDDSSGWMHVVANGETWLVTANLVVRHPPETTVEVDLTERAQSWELSFRTVKASTGTAKPRVRSGCRLATAFEIATATPEPTITVSVDGRVILDVDQDETVPTLYSLPTPVNATASS